MPLWTDIINPADLTGYTRESLANYEANRGTLARYLPNRLVSDINVRFVAGATGLTPIASFRAYDAEPTVGKGKDLRRVVLELPALGQEIPVGEYAQLRQRGSADDTIRNAILDTAEIVARATADAIERARGIVLATGRFTVTPSTFGGAFSADDDYGRAAGHTTNAPAAWSGEDVDILGDWQAAYDAYVERNGEAPGSALTSTRVLRAMGKNKQFRTVLNGGAYRQATLQQVQDTVVGAGFPQIDIYDRRVSVGGVSTRVIPDDKVIFLPAAVGTDDWQGTQLGATFYGQTLTSGEPEYGLAETEQPGIVVGVHRGEKPPMIAEVVSDAIAQPVLANANLSYVLDVL